MKRCGSSRAREKRDSKRLRRAAWTTERRISAREAGIPLAPGLLPVATTPSKPPLLAFLSSAQPVLIGLGKRPQSHSKLLPAPMSLLAPVPR